MLQGVPYALLSQTIGQALLPHLTVQAAGGHYFRMRQTALKVMGVSIALTVPTAIALAVVGLPLIRLIFEHGAFDAHSSELTNLALLGYALALPGLAAGDLISRGYYALKDAHTPLFTNSFSVLTRLGLMVLFFKILPAHLLILAIPLALAAASTAEAGLLSLILLLRLAKRVRTDRGMVRLRRRREQQKMDSR
jgi:putative peptidoglycan lipid II flippase